MTDSHHKRISHEIAKEECVTVKKAVLFQLLSSGEKERRFKRRFYILALATVVLIEVFAMMYVNTKIDAGLNANVLQSAIKDPNIQIQNEVQYPSPHVEKRKN